MLAAVLGMAGGTDPGSSGGAAPDQEGRTAVLRLALERARLSPGDVREVAWAPVGVPLVERDLHALQTVFGTPGPRRTGTVDGAGYADASSALLALVALLSRGITAPVLAFGSSPLGAHWAVVLAPPG